MSMRDGRRETSAKNLGQYAGKGVFKKGHPCANPGGRPKAHRVIQRMIAENTDDGAELVAYALGTMRATATVTLAYGKTYTFKDLPDDGKSRNYAHNWLTERSAGKAPMTVTVSNAETESPVNFDALSDEQLQALAALDAASPQPDAEPEAESGEPGVLH